MKTIGKKTGKILAAAAAALCLSIAAVPSPARADALIEEFWLTMYDVDYYVVVDAPDGGVYLRYGAGTEYPIQLDEKIPNGTLKPGQTMESTGEPPNMTGIMALFSWGRRKEQIRRQRRRLRRRKLRLRQ